jgi:hypothetical protein
VFGRLKTYDVADLHEKSDGGVVANRTDALAQVDLPRKVEPVALIAASRIYSRDDGPMRVLLPIPGKRCAEPMIS